MPAADDLRGRLRAALPAAMKAGDAATVAALRSALAAIDNAEAVESPQGPTEAAHPDLAGTVAGVGAAKAQRRSLPEDEVERIVRAEVADRRAAAAAYERAGRPERAERLRAEADALGAHLDPAKGRAVRRPGRSGGASPGRR
jgi:uncharacterized protein